MALNLFSPPSVYTPAGPWQRLCGSSTRGAKHTVINCRMTVEKPVDQSSAITRRSANYQPPIWDHAFVKSLTNDHLGESYGQRANKSKENVKRMLDEPDVILHKLELVDTLQRLGVSYHFEPQIKWILEKAYNDSYKNDRKREDLYATALKFRLLRQHNYNVPTEIFNDFTDESDNFKDCLAGDTKGLLNLYEASYLSTSGEIILDKARDFASKHLKQKLKDDEKTMIDSELADLVTHAFELPLHWRIARLEARWFIHEYEKRAKMDPNLLEFAKLDFNMVQATHQEELKHLFGWWEDLGWGEKLKFARDRMMEHFMWTIGLNFTPHFQNERRVLTKVTALITTIDDVYDIYGTLEELKLFTHAVERWNCDEIEQLPDYMKICFLGLYNSVNHIAHDTLKEQDFSSIPYLKKGWADLCRSYLVEAEWYNKGYTPTLEEYMNNAWISVSGPVFLLHAYFLTTNNHVISEEVLELCLKNQYPNIIRLSATIFRLADDLAISLEEVKIGDVPKSIQCYMHETGASEEEAREHMRGLISETWKKMNEERFAASSVFPQSFIDIAVNLARMAQCMYQYGDGHGSQNSVSIDRILSLFVNHICSY